MTERPGQVTPARQSRRTIHLSSYVELSIEEATRLLSSPARIEVLLERAIREVLGDAGSDLALEVGAVSRVSAGSASMTVSWSLRNTTQQLVAGHAGVAILIVQSGSDPLTEVLVTIEVAEQHHEAVARTTRAILDRVTAELAEIARSGPT